MTYRNFLPLCDESLVLKNPHKGWYFHYLDNGYTRPTYRNEPGLYETLGSFPGMHHLYLRFDWYDIEKDDGVYDWSYLDEIMETYGKLGFRFSLRLCTFEVNNASPLAFPAFLLPKIKTTEVKTGEHVTYEPDYGDPVYFEYLERFFTVYGKKYDGDPRIAYIDVGTFGTWGEGHTFCGSNKQFSCEVIRAHIDLHRKYFPHTTILVNDDMINHAILADKEQGEALLDRCVEQGLGIRDDGIGVKYYSETFGYDTLRNPDWFLRFTANAPCDIESEHYSRVEPQVYRDGLPLIEALRTAHATYAGFHGYAAPWLERYPYLAAYLANRLGYWYELCGMELPDPVSGSTVEAVLTVKNKGYSRAYHRYDLKLYAQNGDTRFLLNAASPDNRLWLAESVNSVPLALDFSGVPAGTYDLLCEMTSPEGNIRLAFRESVTTPDLQYRLGSITVK